MTGARRFNLDAFLLALEGWRRGLTLRWYHEVPPESNIKLIGFNPIGKIFSLSDDKKTHYFYRSRGDLVSNEAVEIAGDKFKTKQLLASNSVDTPNGKSFDESCSIDTIFDYAKNLDGPVVIKPTFGSLGNGVFTYLSSESEIEYAIKYNRNELNYMDILVEEYIEGIDVRLYIVDNQVVASTKREPASIVGDGLHTIEELIEIRNKERKKNPQLSTRLVSITNDLKTYLERQQLTISSVPEKGTKIFLSGKANVSSGGDSINMDHVPPNVAKQAIEALNALPMIKQGGVDLIYNESRASVLEINATAGIVLHILPAIGKPIRVEEKIIDYYFPKSANTEINTRIYFNYKKVSSLLKNKLVNHLEVTDVPATTLIAKKYTVKGKVQGVYYRRYVQKHAIKLGLNGYTKNLKNGDVLIVAASEKLDALKEFITICYEGPEKAKVNEIIEEDWEKQINIGFEIK